MTLPTADGDVLSFSTYTAMGNLELIYTGDGFDTASSSGTDSDDHELTAITAAAIGDANYLVIELLLSCYSDTGTDTSSGTNSIQLQTKDIGGSYADTFVKTTIHQLTNAANSSGANSVTSFVHMKWVHTLTSNEKSAGVQVKVLAESVVSGTGANASITNKQTTLYTLV